MLTSEFSYFTRAFSIVKCYAMGPMCEIRTCNDFESILYLFIIIILQVSDVQMLIDKETITNKNITAVYNDESYYTNYHAFEEVSYNHRVRLSNDGLLWQTMKLLNSLQ